jgi:hypothetical protein
MQTFAQLQATHMTYNQVKLKIMFAFDFSSLGTYRTLLRA